MYNELFKWESGVYRNIHRIYGDAMQKPFIIV